MIKADLPDLRKVLDTQAQVFGRQKLDDATVEAYWEALRDIPLEAVKQLATNHLRRGKFPAKPSDLRPKGADGVHFSSDAQHSAHLAMLELARAQPRDHGYLTGVLWGNEQTWREFRARDPALAEIEYGIAQWGRILAADGPESPQYAEAVQEDRRLRDARSTLLARRHQEATP